MKELNGPGGKHQYKYMLADDGAFLCGLAYVQDVGGKRSVASGDTQYTTGVGGYSALNSD